MRIGQGALGQIELFAGANPLQIAAAAASQDETLARYLFAVAALYGFDGTDLARIDARAPADNRDNALNALATLAQGMLWNGTAWDRAITKYPTTVFASAARTASPAFASFATYGARMLVIHLNVTVVPGGDTITLDIRSLDPLASVWTTRLTAVAVSATGLYTYVITPFTIPTADNVTLSRVGFVASSMRISVTHSGAGSFTYSVGAVLLP